MHATAHIAPQQPPPGAERPLPAEVDPRRATPVYGTAAPAAGVSGALRRQAYSLPTHDPKRWLLLLAADRAESTAHLARETITPGRQGLVVRHLWRQMRSHPRGSAALGALLLGGAALLARDRLPARAGRWERRRRRGVQIARTAARDLTR